MKTKQNLNLKKDEKNLLAETMRCRNDPIFGQKGSATFVEITASRLFLERHLQQFYRRYFSCSASKTLVFCVFLCVLPATAIAQAGHSLPKRFSAICRRACHTLDSVLTHTHTWIHK